MSGPIVHQDKFLFQYINSFLSYKNIYDKVVDDIKKLGDIVKKIYREEGGGPITWSFVGGDILNKVRQPEPNWWLFPYCFSCKEYKKDDCSYCWSQRGGDFISVIFKLTVDAPPPPPYIESYFEYQAQLELAILRSQLKLAQLRAQLE